MTAIALLSAVMTGVVACSSAAPSQEVSFSTAVGGTVVAEVYAATGSDAVVLAPGASSPWLATGPTAIATRADPAPLDRASAPRYAIGAAARVTIRGRWRSSPPSAPQRWGTRG